MRSAQLAAAFNRVQSTAAELLDRQASNRRNVSLMFANVARRTQNLVHRQLAVVDELERNEQDPKLLDGLYRLDHLSTRLRRSADKLLVVAGSREQAMITGPIELATALRSALAEIEDYKRVRLGALVQCHVGVAGRVGSRAGLRRAARERHRLLTTGRPGRAQRRGSRTTAPA